jgi:hypothetical protein
MRAARDGEGVVERAAPQEVHADPAHRWLRETVRKVGASLDDPAPTQIADVDTSHGERAFPELAPAS